MRMRMRIGIVAPARKVFPEEMKFAVEWLHSMGMEAVFDERLFASDHIFAGSDAFRAAVIQEYMDRPDIDALWLARGGYGSIRIIDQLDFSRFVLHPKPFIALEICLKLSRVISSPLEIFSLTKYFIK